MIIGIDATRANKEHKTGVEWYSYHLIRELTRIDTRHTYRLYFRNKPEPGLQNLGPNVQYRVLQWPPKYLWTQLRLSFEMLINPPDLLFIPAQIIPIIHPTKTVTTIHDVAYKPYPKSYSFKSRLYLDFAARLAKKLPLILTISNFSKREINHYYSINPDVIDVIPLGFKHEVREPSPMILTQHEIQKPFILSVGRLERKKNTKVIVESFNLIKKESWGAEYQLVLVGTKGHGWGEIEKVIAASPFKRDIKLVGWVPEQDKHSLLYDASVFLLVSAYEGFGLPLLEAMDAETPIITSDQASLPEVAGDAAIIVPRGNTEAIREAVKQIKFDTKLRNSLIAAGKQRVEKYTWKETARKTANSLHSLLMQK